MTVVHVCENNHQTDYGTSDKGVFEKNTPIAMERWKCPDCRAKLKTRVLVGDTKDRGTQ